MNFKYKHSSILSLISQCKKEGLITDDERRIMKEFIVTKEPDLTLDLEQYEKDHDLRKMLESLKVMSELTQMSSPVDNNLIDTLDYLSKKYELVILSNYFTEIQENRLKNAKIYKEYENERVNLR